MSTKDSSCGSSAAHPRTTGRRPRKGRRLSTRARRGQAPPEALGHHPLRGDLRGQEQRRHRQDARLRPPGVDARCRPGAGPPDHGGGRHLREPPRAGPRSEPGGVAPRPFRAVVTGASRLTVLAGPTAVGKGTVAASVRQHHPEVWLSVSATTRRPRPGEVDGIHYHFVSDAEFERMAADRELLEWAVVHGRARYGTPRAPVEQALAAGRPALLEIDLQGARQVRESMPEALFVFLAPPSWDELVRRLVGRGTEDAEEREARLATARVELAAAEEFDVTVLNDDVRRAAEELVSLMRSPVPEAKRD